MEIRPIGVVFGGLLADVEPPATTWVCAAPRDIQPIALIAVNVVVDELGFEPRGTGTPVASQLMHEVAGDHLSEPVAEVAGGLQLAHRGID